MTWTPTANYKKFIRDIKKASNDIKEFVLEQEYVEWINSIQIVDDNGKQVFTRVEADESDDPEGDRENEE